MAETTHVDIVSAEKSIFSGEAEMVIVPGELGEIGVIPGHAPLLTVLQPGDIRLIRPGGLEEVYYVSGGMLEVQPYVVTVLADEVIRAEEINEEAALAAKAKEPSKAVPLSKVPNPPSKESNMLPIPFELSFPLSPVLAIFLSSSSSLAFIFAVSASKTAETT